MFRDVPECSVFLVLSTALANLRKLIIATLDGEANFLLGRVLAFGRVIWFNSRLMEELASSPETSSKAVESSWGINLPNSKNTGLLIKNRKLTCTDARTKKWLSKLTISLQGKSYITSISMIKQKISWKNGTGSWFGHKIGRVCWIEKKKKAGKRYLRTPIVDPRESSYVG